MFVPAFEIAYCCEVTWQLFNTIAVQSSGHERLRASTQARMLARQRASEGPLCEKL